MTSSASTSRRAPTRRSSARSPTALSSTASFAEHGIEAVIHAGALHKPDIVRYPAQAFVDVNVTGTLNLLEAAAAAGARPLRLHLDHLADDLARRSAPARRAAPAAPPG